MHVLSTRFELAIFPPAREHYCVPLLLEGLENNLVPRVHRLHGQRVTVDSGNEIGSISSRSGSPVCHPTPNERLDHWSVTLVRDAKSVFYANYDVKFDIMFQEIST